jgi:HSP20 family protein
MTKKMKTQENQAPEVLNTQESENLLTSANKKAIFSKEGELVVDVYETQAEFVVTSAIAGVIINDVDISIEKDMMIIKGERKDPNQVLGKKYLYQECYWGPFSKKVILPENIKIKEASAEMDKGILTIKFPKTEKNIKGKIGVKEA